jgi:hypothetical protein
MGVLYPLYANIMLSISGFAARIFALPPERIGDAGGREMEGRESRGERGDGCV